MNKVYRAAIWLWFLAVTSLAVIGIAMLQKRLGRLQAIPPLLYFMGPLFCFIASAALITTARGGKHTADWNDPKKRDLLKLISAVLVSLASWMAIVGAGLLVRLFTPLPMTLIWVLAYAATTLAFIFGWLRIRRFKLLGLATLAAFLFQLSRSLAAFFR